MRVVCVVRAVRVVCVMRAVRVVWVVRMVRAVGVVKSAWRGARAVTGEIPAKAAVIGISSRPGRSNGLEGRTRRWSDCGEEELVNQPSIA